MHKIGRIIAAAFSSLVLVIMFLICIFFMLNRMFQIVVQLGLILRETTNVGSPNSIEQK
jgi:hypothetical protein